MSEIITGQSKINCYICLGQVHFISYAAIAPWIIEKCGLNRFLTNFYECKNCDFVFFEPGYSEREMSVLYGDYRSHNYWSLRFKWEPWLRISSANELSRKESNTYLTRKDFFNSVMNGAGVDLTKIEGVIDFGGDLGQFIPSETTGIKIVVDKSVKENYSNDGITFVNTFDNILGIHVDLIMICHVLEHLTDFRKILEETVSILNQGGYLYIEVPTDKFRVNYLSSSRSYLRYLKFISKKKFFFILVDFITGLYRTFYSRIPALGIVKQSEHICYFSRNALENLAKLLGLDVVYFEQQMNMRQGRIKIGSQGILLQKL